MLSQGAAAQLTDSHSRKMDYLRISVTDRCNFRCQYCMPEDIVFRDKSEILTLEEMLTFAEACLKLGVNKVRVTGGEPLVRRNVVWFVGQLKELGFDEVTMTTNAYVSVCTSSISVRLRTEVKPQALVRWEGDVGDFGDGCCLLTRFRVRAPSFSMRELPPLASDCGRFGVRALAGPN
jgi:uncharacterized radical SAM superfamily Fe-S cluster-containing enzyme